MDTRAIAFAVPFFFLLIGIELALDMRRRRRAGAQVPSDRAAEPAYRFADAITSLGCGIGEQVLAIAFVSSVALVAYALVYEHLRVATIPMSSVVGWIAAVLLVDLGYYAYHRASHRINFFWATHLVHHQSEEYNLGTALRQSWFTALTSWLFYLPLAVLGFSPIMFLVAHTGNTLYQFWIHARNVGKLGVFEKVLNTPSHHRVHHGIDPEYIDKNYGGIFIVFDRLFGTFHEETFEPAYGTVKPLSSFNPLWANFEGFARLADMSRRTARWRDKVLVWVMPPEWHPEDLGGIVIVPRVDHATRRKYGAEVSPWMRRYVAFHFVVTSIGVSALLYWDSVLMPFVRWSGVALVLATVVIWGGLFERRRWARVAEVVRLIALVAFAYRLTRA